MMSASGESVSSVGGKDGSNCSSSSESSVRSNSFGRKTFFGAIGPSYTLPKAPRIRPSPLDDVVRSCYMRKLEGRKKFFVLRRGTGAKPARLEYYETEKKFIKGKPPKKTMILKDCFDISQTDSKRMFAIALHTINDCVRIAMSNEGDMNHWLRDLHALAEEDEGQDQSQRTEKPEFENLWYVTVVKKGLGKKENIVGPYRLGLSLNEVTLLKVGESNGRNGIIKFPLNAIRGVSHDAMFGSQFNVDLGRRVTIGPGLLSFKTDANKIAQKMHLVFLENMRNLNRDEPLPENWRSMKGKDYVPTTLFINGNEDYYYMNHSPPIPIPVPEKFTPPTVTAVKDEYFPMNFGRVQDVHFIPSSSSEPQSGTSSTESSFKLEKISSYFTDQLIDMTYVRRYSAGSRSGSASSSSSSTYVTQTLQNKRRKKN